MVFGNGFFIWDTMKCHNFSCSLKLLIILSLPLDPLFQNEISIRNKCDQTILFPKRDQTVARQNQNELWEKLGHYSLLAAAASTPSLSRLPKSHPTRSPLRPGLYAPEVFWEAQQCKLGVEATDGGFKSQMWVFCLVLLQSKWSPFHNFLPARTRHTHIYRCS